MPLVHIQKIAPGPPSSTAIAMPAIAPSPTVPESAAVSAWKCVSAPGPSVVSTPPLPQRSAMPCVSERYCEKPLHTVNTRPVSSRPTSTGTESRMPLSVSTRAKSVSIASPKTKPPAVRPGADHPKAQAAASLLCRRE